MIQRAGALLDSRATAPTQLAPFLSRLPFLPFAFFLLPYLRQRPPAESLHRGPSSVRNRLRTIYLPARTAATVATAAAIASTAATAAAIFAWLGFVDVQGAAAHVLAIKLRNRRIAFF